MFYNDVNPNETELFKAFRVDSSEMFLAKKEIHRFFLVQFQRIVTTPFSTDVVRYLVYGIHNYM